MRETKSEAGNVSGDFSLARSLHEKKDVESVNPEGIESSMFAVVEGVDERARSVASLSTPEINEGPHLTLAHLKPIQSQMRSINETSNPLA
jgi:hypothetical protein